MNEIAEKIFATAKLATRMSETDDESNFSSLEKCRSNENFENSPCTLWSYLWWKKLFC